MRLIISKKRNIKVNLKFPVGFVVLFMYTQTINNFQTDVQKPKLIRL